MKIFRFKSTKQRIWLVLLTFLFSSNILALEISTKIIGGYSAPEFELDTIVSLKFSNDLYSEQFFCSGTLINKNWVVTAAHCLFPLGKKLNKEELTVTVSDYDFSDNLEGVSVTEIVIHPDFNDVTLENDIALLKLSEPSNVPHILMSNVSKTVITNNATIWGWGSLDEVSLQLPDILQKADTNILPNLQCSLRLGTAFFGDSMLCATVDNANIDSCYGDSGGPIIVNNKLVGITSWGFGCADPDYPGVYTRIDTYKSWLDHIIFNIPLKNKDANIAIDNAAQSGTSGGAINFSSFWLLLLLTTRYFFIFNIKYKYKILNKELL